MDILTYVEGPGRHSIDVLLAIYALTEEKNEKDEKVSVGWKEVADWILRNMNSKISDGTYRCRRDELCEMGLIELTAIDALRSKVKMTAKGMTVASSIKEFFQTIKNAEAESQK